MMWAVERSNNSGCDVYARGLPQAEHGGERDFGQARSQARVRAWRNNEGVKGRLRQGYVDCVGVAHGADASRQFAG